MKRYSVRSEKCIFMGKETPCKNEIFIPVLRRGRMSIKTKRVHEPGLNETYEVTSSKIVYRVTIQVMSNLPLTPNQRWRFSTWASY